ncbi:MAG: hypothetical protein US89_C0004G0023 [Candidatus Peregrinibacteria bacterium GW2011_GWF2_38_29]|nr:MAG: hypothetical protein US89_C0004G0023 [Candidatus Peregrinibacteria bacterium GW2011_GWF2_38_29]HBB02960.1 hypothetical protein [Candidatus Peregrinibacteria bacterium]
MSKKLLIGIVAAVVLMIAPIASAALIPAMTFVYLEPISTNKEIASTFPGDIKKTYLQFYLRSLNDKIIVNSVRLELKGTKLKTGDIKNVSLYSKNNKNIPLATVPSIPINCIGTSCTGGYNFNLTGLTLVKNTFSPFLIQADIASDATIGGDFQMYVTNKMSSATAATTGAVAKLNSSSVYGRKYVVHATPEQTGKLNVITMTTPVASTVATGTQNFTFANFELNTYGSSEDVKVSKLVVTDIVGSGVEGATDNYSGVTNLKMYQGSNVLATASSTATNANIVKFNFVSPITVLKGKSVVLTLKADVVSSKGTSHTFKIAQNDDYVMAVGANTGNTITGNNLNEYGNGQLMTVVQEAGKLTVSLVSGVNATPTENQTVNIGTTGGTYFAFKLTAQNEPIKVTSLKLTVNGSPVNDGDLQNVKLVDQNGTVLATTGGLICSSNTTCYYKWIMLDILVNPSTPLTIYVKSDIGGKNIANLGNDFQFRITDPTVDIAAVGSTSADIISPENILGGTIGGNSGRTTIVPFFVTVKADVPAPGSVVEQTIVAGTVLGRFKVINNGSAQIELTNVKLQDNGTHTGTVLYKLYASQENSSNYIDTLLATGTSVDFSTLSTFITINGGAYRYLSIMVSNIGDAVAGDSWQLSVASLGDLKYGVAESGLGYSGNPADDNDLADTVPGLMVNGKPYLGTISKK